MNKKNETIIRKREIRNCKNKIVVSPYFLRIGWRRFCSNKCRGTWVSKLRLESQNPNWKGDKVGYQAKEIRDRYNKGENQYELAKEFNVDQGTISNIVNHKIQYYG